MYKKIIFILLTLLFMSGSCNLDGKKPNAISKKAHTPSLINSPTLPGSTTANPIQEPLKTFKTQISLTETNRKIKFKNVYLGIVLYNKPVKYDLQVEEFLISTTEDALRAAGIADLRDAKGMTDQVKLKELIESLTFTITIKTENKNINININDKEFTIIIDYENLKMIYDGLYNKKNNPNLKLRLNSNGRDVEFNKGYTAFADGGGYFDTQNSKTSFMFDSTSRNPVIIKILGDILGINSTEDFKLYLP